MKKADKTPNLLLIRASGFALVVLMLLLIVSSDLGFEIVATAVDFDVEGRAILTRHSIEPYPLGLGLLIFLVVVLGSRKKEQARDGIHEVSQVAELILIKSRTSRVVVYDSDASERKRE